MSEDRAERARQQAETIKGLKRLPTTAYPGGVVLSVVVTEEMAKELQCAFEHAHETINTKFGEEPAPVLGNAFLVKLLVGAIHREKQRQEHLALLDLKKKPDVKEWRWRRHHGKLLWCGRDAGLPQLKRWLETLAGVTLPEPGGWGDVSTDDDTMMEGAEDAETPD